MKAVATDPVAAALDAARRPVWLRVGRLFSGRDTTVLRDAHVVYDAKWIRHVGTEPPPATALRVGQHQPDLVLPDHTLLPGLTDAHTHLFLEGGERVPARRAEALKLPGPELLARAEARLEPLVRLGVIAVREAGDKAGIGLRLQQRWHGGDRGIMPYIDAPGAAIHRQGRYGSFMAHSIEEAGNAEAAVAQRVSQGAHRIKLIATSIINFERGEVVAPPQMDAEELTHLAELARAGGRQTMVHCSGHAGVANCLAAHVDSVEHGFFVDDDQLRRLRDLDIVWVPTFAPVQYQVDDAATLGWSDSVQDNLRRILDDHARRLVTAVKLGVRVVAGSDAGSHGVPHGWGFLRELELMQRAGLSAPEVLHAATGAGASRLGYGEPFGLIRPGFRPRFLLTRHDVLADVRQLQRDKVVVFDDAVLADGEPAREGM